MGRRMYFHCCASLIIWTTGVESLNQRHIASLRVTGWQQQQNSSHQAGALSAHSNVVIINGSPQHKAEQIWLLALLFFGGLLLAILLYFQSSSKAFVEVPHWIQEDLDNVDMHLKNERPDLTDAFIYFLMNTSWPVVGLIFFEIYLLVAAFFATLMMIQPNSLTVDPLPVRFMDAFNFSVQTLATIGYGVLSPATDWAHTIVIVESYVGLIMNCIGGGILFSRVNRPTSRLAFSDVVVVSQNEKGQIELTMRMLNHRLKSSWLDVHASMSVLILEGKIRALRQLKLRREWNPILHGAWMITHTIDDSSPLAGLVAADKANEKVMALVVFVKGVEATYSQQLHAHRVYYTNQFCFGKCFCDMIEIQDNGIVLDPTLLSSTEEKDSGDTAPRVYFH